MAASTRVTPGSFEYSNTGFWYLGSMLEELSGMSRSPYLHRKVFEPADMRETRNPELETSLPPPVIQRCVPARPGPHIRRPPISCVSCSPCLEIGVCGPHCSSKKQPKNFYHCSSSRTSSVGSPGVRGRGRDRPQAGILVSGVVGPGILWLCFLGS
ncbi:serine hydrolase [Arthrobacter sp. MYb227]|uniref:serine hydrolase n=1 Tax=Arthrobacter sp. MYb227 TaxID=1848601 RepID=UPI0015E42034